MWALTCSPNWKRAAKRLVVVFFFKQKTADGSRISARSSDVCSSDLPGRGVGPASLERQDAEQFPQDLDRQHHPVGGQHPQERDRLRLPVSIVDALRIGQEIGVEGGGHRPSRS